MPPNQHRPPVADEDEGLTLLTSFNTFLTVAVHNILYYRGIYPEATFLSARAYNLPVHQNRHPRVCAWINDAVDAVGAQLADGHVNRVAVVIHSPTTSQQQHQPKRRGRPSTQQASVDSQTGDQPKPGSVLERWTFDVSRFPAWPGSDKAYRKKVAQTAEGQEQDDETELDIDAAAAFTADRHQGIRGAINWYDVDEQLRGALTRMAQTAEKMDPLPEGCTFTIAVELREEGHAPIGNPQTWIPSESSVPPASRQGVPKRAITAIRSVGAGPLFFECWVEEAKT